MLEWINALQDAINAVTYQEDQSLLGREYGLSRFKERLSISSIISSSLTGELTEDQDPVHLLQSLVGNERCADCNGETPLWASINMGILLCTECSVIHRGLGIHISKIKSFKVDKWDPMSIQVSFSNLVFSLSLVKWLLDMNNSLYLMTQFSY